MKGIVIYSANVEKGVIRTVDYGTEYEGVNRDDIIRQALKDNFIKRCEVRVTIDLGKNSRGEAFTLIRGRREVISERDIERCSGGNNKSNE